MKNRRAFNAGSEADSHTKKWGTRRVVVTFCLLIALAVTGYYLLQAPVYGVQLGNRSMQLSSSEVGVVSNYLLRFHMSTPSNLGSIDIQFCANDPLIGDPCTVPPGFDASAAVLTNQAPAGFTISNASTANDIILTRPTSFAPVGPATFEFTGITNPSVPGSYYVRLQTFSNSTATGPFSNYGGIAIAFLNQVAISAEVPPFLMFCTGLTIPGFNCANAAGDFIDFGELSSSRASSGSSKMLVATNAGSGYNITVDGPTMASGVNVINGLTTSDVSRPGTGQFGFNLRANTTPADGSNPAGPGTGNPTAAYNQPNFYRLNSGDVIVTNAGPEDLREFTSSYIVNVPASQAPGIYVTTLTYIALATF